MLKYRVDVIFSITIRVFQLWCAYSYIRVCTDSYMYLPYLVCMHEWCMHSLCADPVSSNPLGTTCCQARRNGSIAGRNSRIWLWIRRPTSRSSAPCWNAWKKWSSASHMRTLVQPRTVDADACLTEHCRPSHSIGSPNKCPNKWCYNNYRWTFTLVELTIQLAGVEPDMNGFQRSKVEVTVCAEPLAHQITSWFDG